MQVVLLDQFYLAEKFYSMHLGIEKQTFAQPLLPLTEDLKENLEEQHQIAGKPCRRSLCAGCG